MDGFWGSALQATLAIVLLAAPLVAILIWIWRWSPREARKQLTKTLEAGFVLLPSPVRGQHALWRFRRDDARVPA